MKEKQFCYFLVINFCAFHHFLIHEYTFLMCGWQVCLWYRRMGLFRVFCLNNIWCLNLVTVVCELNNSLSPRNICMRDKLLINMQIFRSSLYILHQLLKHVMDVNMIWWHYLLGTAVYQHSFVLSNQSSLQIWNLVLLFSMPFSMPMLCHPSSSVVRS